MSDQERLRVVATTMWRVCQPIREALEDGVALTTEFVEELVLTLEAVEAYASYTGPEPTKRRELIRAGRDYLNGSLDS